MSSVHAVSVLLLFLLFLHLSDSRHLDNVHITDSQFSLDKDQNGVPGLTSKEPVRVSRIVLGVKKNHHRRQSLLFADYPKPSTRPPRHN
ncbi:protein GOLVEN 10-like [Raphanus sativus]|uniref:Protein GOLVEN 10 n=1 Tax=Raphanus sativus TaxID=3726 RepID=A0A6J0MU46_RAPSA|nr:protein GOLVEN 10 [Raphanus sativus]XP_018475646.1 PREDICTED: root meristem growth factor 5-like [Raphanus sativus]XP_056851073.1 protein GOLVEN 10-like [Raphanus sativus]